jgi:hypothetical protein
VVRFCRCSASGEPSKRGGLSVDEALATVGVDGSVLGDELARIG